MFVHKLSITLCLLQLRPFGATLRREKSDTQCACRTLCQSVLRNTEHLDTCVEVMCNFLAFWTLSATLRRTTITSIISVRPSVRLSLHPHWKLLLTLDRFSWNFLLEVLTEICRFNLILVKVGRKLRTLYTNTWLRLWQLPLLMLPEVKICYCYLCYLGSHGC
jgi:hypothetical protein